jgi:hypothetical protein
MIRFQDIKEGDIIQADFEGQRFEGVVTELNLEDKQVCVHNGDQEDWFEPKDLYPIPVDDQQLQKLGFEKQVNGDKSVKYLRGPFRILIPGSDQFDEFEIWYREDHRHLRRSIGVHELQNFYHQMTKVDLSRV